MTRCVKVIPCLDLRDGRVVKGVQFQNLADAGDPGTLALKYADVSDEVMFLDVTGSAESRRHMTALLAEVAGKTNTPLTAGGGVTSVESALQLLAAGANRVSVGSAAVRTPELIDSLVKNFGATAITVSVDVKENRSADKPRYEVTTGGGKTETGLDALDWLKEIEERGASAVLLNSISTDGAQTGFDLELLAAARGAVNIEIIASGGAGSLEHFPQAAQAGANAVLAASVFHFGLVEVEEVTQALSDAGYRDDCSEALDLDLKLNEDGLVAAVVQDPETLRVLMVGWMDPEALRRTLESGLVTFWSRSRKEYWRKGDTSGNTLRLDRIEVDCDRDALLVLARPTGPTCHTGATSCFDVGGTYRPR